MVRAEVERCLVALRERRAALVRERQAVSRESRHLIRKARETGMTYAEIMELAGVSKQGVRDFLRAGE